MFYGKNFFTLKLYLFGEKLNFILKLCFKQKTEVHIKTIFLGEKLVILKLYLWKKLKFILKMYIFGKTEGHTKTVFFFKLLKFN